ncbi:MAG: signal peptide peptidase SppA [Nitrospiraceae bacterium]
MRKMFVPSTKLIVLTVVLLLTGCITVNLLPMPGPLEERQLSGEGSSKILLLEVTGLISSHQQSQFMAAPSLVSDFKEQLTLAADDPDVKALVLRVNSPGGTVTASDVLYHEVRMFKAKRNVPVVVWIMDVGASGAYYLAVAGDRIVAHPSSVTGSLGVIMLTVNASGLLEKIGVEATAVTSGPRKDMGSPFRPMTDEERQIFQGVITSFYERFLTVIGEGRSNLSADQVRELADGRIYTGEQAKALGLVDSVGYLEDAIDLAKEQADLKESRVVTYRRPGEYRHNIYSQYVASGGAWAPLSDLDLMSLVRGGTPQFMYLWMP